MKSKSCTRPSTTALTAASNISTSRFYGWQRRWELSRVSLAQLKRQQHRSNIQVDAVFDHYKINIAIPFLDHVISDLYAQFSRKFAKRNFRHIGWISINSLSIYCYFHVYYRYIHLYSTVCYCCIATGSCTLRGLHPAG